MGQKISYEDAFPTFQKKCSELFEANLLLQAQVDVLERQLAAAEADNARSVAPQQPAAGGPDLAAQPLYPEEQG